MTGPAAERATSTLRVVLLGAETYERTPDWSHPAIGHSARALLAYLRHPDGLALQDAQLLDLFDSPLGQAEQLDRLRQFLAAEGALSEPRDVLLLFIGHGDRLEADGGFAFTVRDSQRGASASLLRAADLDSALRERAGHDRVYCVFDACFAAGALKDMLKANDEGGGKVDPPAADGGPARGLSMLCAAAPTQLAWAPSADSPTLFTAHLLDALYDRQAQAERLSLRELEAATRKRIGDAGGLSLPEGHSPRKQHGDLADWPLLPVLRRTPRAVLSPPPPAALGERALVLVVTCRPRGGLGADVEGLSLAQQVENALGGAGSGEIWGAVQRARASCGPALAEGTNGAVTAPDFVFSELASGLAFDTPDALAAAVRALAQAEAVVFDLSGFDPALMFLLGVRAVARRGVTLASVDHALVFSQMPALPFNLQLLNLSTHAAPGSDPSYEASAKRIRHKLAQGFRELAERPHYMDLPTYDAVRQLGGASSAYAPVRAVDKILLLCPFTTDYELRVWPSLQASLPAEVAQRLMPGAEPVLERLLDMQTPRLVSQTLYETIRRAEMCVIDWTGLRPNVMFEAGVRLAVNPLGAVHIIEAGPADGTPRGLLGRFDPIRYQAKGGMRAACQAIVAGFERQLDDNRKGELGAVYRALGQALDPRTQPVAPSVADELLRQADALEGDNEDSTGLSPTLFNEVNPALVEQARAGAAERRLAAWLYLSQRGPASDDTLLHLAALVRPWARANGLIDLVLAIDARVADLHPTPLATAPPQARPALAESPDAAVMRLQALVRNRKARAEDCRDRGDLEGAEGLMADAVRRLKAARLYGRLDDDTPPSPELRQYAALLADALGMHGGSLRRLGRLADAMACLEEGQLLELRPALGIDSSYNLVNYLTLPLFDGTPNLAAQCAGLEQARAAIFRQLRGARRSVRWAWADHGQCLLLLGRTAEARPSYRRVRELSHGLSLKPVADMLARLATTLAATDPSVAAGCREIADELGSGA